MEDISLHILDVVENSTSAGATLVEIYINDDISKDLLEVRIKDNGKGMDEEMVKNVHNPFITTRTTRRVGLGISLFYQSAMEANGNFEIKSTPGFGTEIKAAFQSSHIDRKPLGDIASTMISLIIGNPEIDFLCHMIIGNDETILDTREIKEELEGISITEPAVLNLIRELFNSKGN